MVDFLITACQSLKSTYNSSYHTLRLLLLTAYLWHPHGMNLTSSSVLTEHLEQTYEINTSILAVAIPAIYQRDWQQLSMATQARIPSSQAKSLRNRTGLTTRWCRPRAQPYRWRTRVSMVHCIRKCVFCLRNRERNSSVKVKYIAYLLYKYIRV